MNYAEERSSALALLRRWVARLSVRERADMILGGVPDPLSPPQCVSLKGLHQRWSARKGEQRVNTPTRRGRAPGNYNIVSRITNTPP